MSSIPEKQVHKYLGNESAKPDKQSAQKTLEARQSEELVLAFAGPVGCGTDQVISQAKSTLESAGYEVHIIKLSKIIENAISEKTISLDKDYEELSPNVRRTFRLQDGGNKLRLISSSYLAERAIKEIMVQRGHHSKAKGFTGDIQEYVPARVAYLIDQIKHQDEVALLRVVYRKLFHLIGVISVADKRRNRLLTIDRANLSEISELMERDRKQDQDNGQQLDKVLKLADFYISTDASTISPLQRKLKRFVGLLHGENGISPTTQEYGMYTAYSAGLQSACLSRQVGASISDLSGKIVSTGCNDVPKSLGGLYTSEDGAGDRRCVHREEQVCFNDREKLSNKADMRQALKELTTENDGSTKQLIPDSQLDAVLETVFKASHINDLTEFSRAVHAEMDAIISLARTGTPGILGAKLFTTTFPCHSCARHIVAAGISKVYYIEPYEKSLAQKLHADAIEFDTEDDEEEKVGHNAGPAGNQVKFIHFEGVTPRQYLNFFQMPKRKESDGRVIKIMLKDAPKAVGEFLDNYRSFEAKVVQRIEESEPRLTVVEGENSGAE